MPFESLLYRLCLCSLAHDIVHIQSSSSLSSFYFPRLALVSTKLVTQQFPDLVLTATSAHLRTPWSLPAPRSLFNRSRDITPSEQAPAEEVKARKLILGLAGANRCHCHPRFNPLKLDHNSFPDKSPRCRVWVNIRVPSKRTLHRSKPLGRHGTALLFASYRRWSRFCIVYFLFSYV